jgi:hypothetical protein
MPKGARLVISCAAPPSESIVAVALSEQPSPSIATPTASPAIDNSKMNIDRLESLIQNEETVSHLSIPAAVATVDSIVNTVSSSPDNLSTAMGYLERFVQIGDAIAEVSESSFDFIVIINLSAGSSLCQTCVERTNRRAQGWLCIYEQCS